VSICARWRSTTGLLTLAVVVILLLAGFAVMSRTYWWGLALLLVDFVLAVAAAVLHDRAHRRHGEQPHAMWGLDDRNKPSFLR
jgi:fatty acid desaturase